MMIFGFSLQDSNKSWEESDVVASGLEAVEPVVGELHEKVTGNPMSNYDFRAFIRKSAHFAEFILLGGILMLLTLFIERGVRRLIFMPLFISLLVAVIDEFIQSFMDRTSAVKDIILDFSGAFTGILLIVLAWFIIRRVRAR